MYKELQVVKAVKDLSGTVSEGCLGTVVYVHAGYPQAYEVEFVGKENTATDVLTVMDSDIHEFANCNEEGSE